MRYPIHSMLEHATTAGDNTVRLVTVLNTKNSCAKYSAANKNDMNVARKIGERGSGERAVSTHSVHDRDVQIPNVRPMRSLTSDRIAPANTCVANVAGRTYPTTTDTIRSTATK